MNTPRSTARNPQAGDSRREAQFITPATPVRQDPRGAGFAVAAQILKQENAK